jgi:tRNA (cytidine/uridine-2'-O-)-methyltransferase
MQVALYQPEIPPNTGNIGRICAATETRLHLIGPLGFSLEDKHLRRAGLDYWPHLDLVVWQGWTDFARGPGNRHPLVLAGSKFAPSLYAHVFQNEEVLLFGPESEGLPDWLIRQHPDVRQVRIPIWGGVRSLNLANAVSVCLYEAYRQTRDLSEL